MSNLTKRVVSFLCIAVVFFTFSTVAFTENYGGLDSAKTGVCRIVNSYSVYKARSYNGNYSYEGTMYSCGSAFAVGREGDNAQYFVTNAHVIRDYSKRIEEESIQGVKYYYRFEKEKTCLLFDDNEIGIDYQVVGTHKDGADLAVVKIERPVADRKPLTLRPFSEIGSEDVYLIGYPVVADEALIDSDEIGTSFPSAINRQVVSKGIISRVVEAENSTDKSEIIQSDVAINGGNSGGPLVDENGFVLGVGTFSVDMYNGENVQGVNGCVSVNEVIAMLSCYNIPFFSTETISAKEFAEKASIAAENAGAAYEAANIAAKTASEMAENVDSAGIKVTAYSAVTAAKAAGKAAAEAEEAAKAAAAAADKAELSANAAIEATDKAIKAADTAIEEANNAEAARDTVEKEIQRILAETEKKKTVLIITAAAAGAAVIVTLVIVLLRKKRNVKTAESTPVTILKPTQSIQAADIGTRPADGRTLIGVNGSLSGKRFILEPGKKMTIGRDASCCSICFPKNTAGVSSVHCTILFDGNSTTVVDNESTYGTYIGTKRLQPNCKVSIHRGETLFIGSEQNAFTLQQF